MRKVSIQFRRGPKRLLPEHAEIGEPLFCTDSLELYIGMGKDIPLAKIGIIEPDDFQKIIDYYNRKLTKLGWV